MQWKIQKEREYRLEETIGILPLLLHYDILTRYRYILMLINIVYMRNKKPIESELMKDIISYVKTRNTVENKERVQELFLRCRKIGMAPKTAWERAKEIIQSEENLY